MKKSVIVLLLAIVVVFVLLFILLFSSFQESKRIESFDENCDAVSLQGEKNILFLSHGFEDEKEFKKQIIKKINSVEKIYPFRGAFNFYLIKNPDSDLGCEVNKNKAVICEAYKVQKTAKTCPHDYVIVLSDQEDSYIRSSAFMNFASINNKDNDIVLVHELGHIVGNLADEYVEEGRKPPKKSPNCDSSETCDKWSDKLENVGCYGGCTGLDFFRATQNSIMRDCYSSTEFGPVNEKALAENIGAEQIESKTKKLVYITEFSYKKGNISVSNVEVELGYTPSKTRVEEWFYFIEKNGDVVEKAGINDPGIYFQDGETSEGTLTGKTEQVEEIQFSILAPYVEEADNLSIGRIVDNREEILTSASLEGIKARAALSPPKLSFFSFFSFIITVLIIIIYYLACLVRDNKI